MFWRFACRSQSPIAGVRLRLQRFGAGSPPAVIPRVVVITASCLLSLSLPVHAQEGRVAAKEALKQAQWAAQKHHLSGDRSALRRRVAILMSRIDPQAAVDLCRGISGASDAIRARGAVSAAIAPQDPVQAQDFILAAAKLLRDLTDDNQRSQELAFLSISVAAFDPKDAFRTAREIKDAEVFEYAWGEIARLAPLAALEDLAQNPPSSSERSRRLAAFLPRLAADDLLQALSLSDEITDSLAKSKVLAEISFSASSTDALAVALRIPDDLLRAQAIRCAAERLAATDPIAALGALYYTSADRDSALAGIARAAAVRDRWQAADLIAQIASARTRRDTLGLFLIDLAAEDAAAAAIFADSHAEVPTWALPALCSALVKTDSSSALNRARAITDSHNRDLALAEIAGALARQSPQLAEDLLLEIKRPHLRFSALRALVIAVAPNDVEKAAALTGLAADGRQAQVLLLHIARALAAYDIPGALRLAERCPPSPEKTDAVLDIAEIVAARDLKQALTIASSIMKKSTAGHVLTQRLMRRQPALARKCADEIIDPLRRAHAFCDIAEALLEGADGGSPILLSRPEIQRVVEPGGALGEGLSDTEEPGIEIISALPHQLKIRLPGVQPDFYSVHYQGPGAAFTWENLMPAADGTVVLKDDRHLKPEQRLRCPSRGTRSAPAFFDDFTKSNFSGKQRLPHGIPVSTFGGAGYLSSAPTWLHRDRHGNFWLYQDIRPWRIVAFDSDFNYRFTLVFPTRILALDSDPEANLYVLQEENFLSRFDRDGLPVAHWKLKEGRGRNEFIEASGLAVDPQGNYLYLADRKLGRVLRFDLQMQPAPFPFVPWGWIGREDLGYLEIGAYHPENKYRLDRPARLAVGPEGRLYVDCAYFIMRFDLTTGEQTPFGKSDVLGWGGTFTDSVYSVSAAANGHWQEHCLAGIDPQGNVYVSDTSHTGLRALRLQVFSPQGEFIAKYDHETQINDANGSPAYIVPPLALAFAGPQEKAGIWLAEAGGRVYECSDLISGGRFHLGPGTPGRQFDLTSASTRDFTMERQVGPIRRKVEGEIVTFAEGRRATRNCESERNTEIRSGQQSIWIPTRLGGPFRVTLSEEDREIPATDYLLEIETEPGPFGTHYDFFRITNKSGHTWKNIHFIAETLPGP